MNFEDEAYVRLFTRRTLTNKRLRWEGRAVLHEMLYEFDRAGVFEFEGELADAIETMTGLPERVIRAGLPRILASKTWEVRGTFLVWPNFLHAQTCTRSEAARQRDSRERRRAAARAAGVLGSDDAGHDVTDCDTKSHGVTGETETGQNGHVGSHPVTLSLSLPGLSEPSSHPDAGAGEPPCAPPPESEPPALVAKALACIDDPARSSLVHGPPDSWPEVRAAADEIQAVWPKSGKLRSRDGRALVVVERFAQGYTVEQLAAAARGSKLDPHIAGNPSFQTIATVWRDAGQVDKFMALLASGGPKPKRGATPTQPNHGVTVEAEEYGA